MAIKIKITDGFSVGNKVRFSGTGGGFRAFSQGAMPPVVGRYLYAVPRKPILDGWVLGTVTDTENNFRSQTPVFWDMNQTSPVGYKNLLTPEHDAISDFIQGSNHKIYGVSSFTTDPQAQYGNNYFVLTTFDKLSHVYSGTILSNIDEFGNYTDIVYDDSAEGFTYANKGAYSVDCIKTGSSGNIWIMGRYPNTYDSQTRLWKFDTSSGAISSSTITALSRRLPSFLVDQSENIWTCGYTSNPYSPCLFRFDPVTGTTSEINDIQNYWSDSGFEGVSNGKAYTVIEDVSSNKIWTMGTFEYVSPDTQLTSSNNAFWCTDKTTLATTFYPNPGLTSAGWPANSLDMPENSIDLTPYDIGSWISTSLLHNGKIWGHLKVIVDAYSGGAGNTPYNESLVLTCFNTSTHNFSQKILYNTESIESFRGPSGDLVLSGSCLYSVGITGGKGGGTLKLFEYNIDTDTSSIVANVPSTPFLANVRSSLDSETGKIVISSIQWASDATGDESAQGSVNNIIYYDPSTSSYTTKTFTMNLDGSTQMY